MQPVAAAPDARSAPARFVLIRDAAWRLLPRWIRSWVPATFVGFAALNLTTFGFDLLLLTLLHQVVGLPNPIAVTLAYGSALALAYVLNRWLNFRSHGSIGRQSARYVAVVVINYVVFIMGVGSGLTYLGVQFQLARVLAGLGEAVWMYCAMRWLVFTDTRTRASATTTSE